MKSIIVHNAQQIEHVRVFQQLVRGFCDEIMREAIDHDQSKFSEAEYLAFVESNRSLNASTTGKDEEYQKHFNSSAIRHHLTTNKHHPEYWDAKEEEMPITQVILMFFDWYSRSVQKGTGMDGFWEYNQEKLRKQEHAKVITQALRKYVECK